MWFDPYVICMLITCKYCNFCVCIKSQTICTKWKLTITDTIINFSIIFTLSGSLLSLSHPVSPEPPVTPESTTGMMEGGVCAQPPPTEECNTEGGVLVQPTNGRELWRINWGLSPGGGGRTAGGGTWEEDEEEEAEGAEGRCWDWFWFVCERICMRDIRQNSGIVRC